MKGYGENPDKYCVGCRVKEGLITKSASGGSRFMGGDMIKSVYGGGCGGL